MGVGMHGTRTAWMRGTVETGCWDTRRLSSGQVSLIRLAPGADLRSLPRQGEALGGVPRTLWASQGSNLHYSLLCGGASTSCARCPAVLSRPSCVPCVHQGFIDFTNCDRNAACSTNGEAGPDGVPSSPPYGRASGYPLLSPALTMVLELRQGKGRPGLIPATAYRTQSEIGVRSAASRS